MRVPVEAFHASTSARSRVSIRNAPAYTRMSSCRVAPLNRACQVSVEIMLRVGQTWSISADRYRAVSVGLDNSAGHRNVSCCCRTAADLLTRVTGYGTRSSTSQRPTLFGSTWAASASAAASGRRSASPHEASDSSLTQVTALDGTFQMSRDVHKCPEVRWSYPQLSMMLDSWPRQQATLASRGHQFEEVTS